MQATIKIPITPELLGDMGFKQVTGTPGTFYRANDVELQLAGNGAQWQGHDRVFDCWEEFLEHYRDVKGEDFDPPVDMLRDLLDHEWL